LRAAGQLIAHADDLARRGQTRAALAAYERVLREHPGDPAGASALFGLGRLQADPAGGLRNYRAAQRTFSRLLADYPESRWEAEARTWQAVLGDLLAREAEAARLKEEAVRLRTQIEQLRRTDLDLERRR
jgi:outer membrane protein assembly factor BamD (BamD/ComL family)